MTGPLAGEPRERRRDLPMAHRAGSWLVWWVLMMSFWVMLDDSISTDELLAGAGAAALAALLAEVVTYQAATRFRMRIEWLVPALSLPGQVVRDTVIVYRALWRRLAHGQQPPSAFADLPARYGDKYVAGLVQGPVVAAFVSRGVGVIGLPIRFRCRPEVNLLTLVAA